MPLDPSLAGHETKSERGTIAADDVRAFAEAIGDASAIYRDERAARAAGYARVPAPPTFVTRFRVSFAEAGLDVEHTQVLHGEQEYTYTRPLYTGDAVTVRHRVASIRQSGRGGMAILTLEQLCDTDAGERIATGKATVIVRDAPPEGAAASAAANAAADSAASAATSAPTSAKPRPPEPAGQPIPALTKHITQEQIDAYAKVSGDFNPIHVNPEAARAVGLDGTIAHGMLSMAFLGQLATDWLASAAPGSWLARLRVRFQAMVRPGDTLTCKGVLAAREGDRQRMEVWIENQHGERVTTGDADVVMG